MPSDAFKAQYRVWLPVDIKQCPISKYKKHPNGMYDRDGKWPHWCEGTPQEHDETCFSKKEET